MTEHDRKRLMADQPALVTHCQQCEERVHANRHIKSVNGRFYAICYDCSGEEDGQEPEQKQLVTDGGRPAGGFSDYFWAVYRSGNHASFEGHPAPSRAAEHRIASIFAEFGGGANVE